MPRIKITEKAVERLPVPNPPKQVQYSDTQMPAFGVRVSYSGTKTYLVHVRVLREGAWKLTRVPLGRYPDDIEEMREKAREAIAAAKAGQDPRRILEAEREELEHASVHTFANVRADFIRRYVKGKRTDGTPRCKPSTVVEYERVLHSDDFKSWENRPVSEITKRDVRELLERISEDRGKRTMANRTLAYLRKLMNWAAERDIIEVPPTAHIRAPHTEAPRERVLSDAELRYVWQAAERIGYPFGGIVQTLILTGQRLSEVSEMPWTELGDLDAEAPVWGLPGHRTKNGRPHLVPLAPAAVELLKGLPRIKLANGHDSPLVFTTSGRTPFSGHSKSKARLDTIAAELAAEAGDTDSFAQPWRLHDIRRTAVTGMNELGIPLHVVEAVVNHITGISKGGIRGVYNRAQYLEERRRALELWSAHVGRITGREDPTEADNVVPFQPGA